MIDQRRQFQQRRCDGQGKGLPFILLQSQHESKISFLLLVLVAYSLITIVLVPTNNNNNNNVPIVQMLLLPVVVVVVQSFSLGEVSRRRGRHFLKIPPPTTMTTSTMTTTTAAMVRRSSFLMEVGVTKKVIVPFFRSKRSLLLFNDDDRIKLQWTPQQQHKLLYSSLSASSSPTSSFDNNNNNDNHHKNHHNVDYSTNTPATETVINNYNSNIKKNGIIKQFLGKGKDAIVRPGVVLIAPKNEYHHFYRNAAIFIYAMGEIDQQEDDTDEYIIRGVIIDHPTPFTLSEMITSSASTSASTSNNILTNNPLGTNLIFRGGDIGGTGVIVLHNHKDIGISQIGTSSGVYQGGWDNAVLACSTGQVNPNDFKVFFNYCEFTENELDSLLSNKNKNNNNNNNNTSVQDNEDEDEDAWCSVEVDSSIVLNADYERGDCWSRLRNAVLPYMRQK